MAVKYVKPKALDPRIEAQKAIIADLERSLGETQYKIYKNKDLFRTLTKEQTELKRKRWQLVLMVREARLKFNIPFVKKGTY